MQWFRDLTFRSKLSVLALATSFVALALTVGALVGYEMLSSRRALVSEVAAQARLLGNLGTAALEFEDSKAAGELLEEMRSETSLVSALLVDAQGQQLGVYRRQPFPTAPLPRVAEGPEGHAFGHGMVTLRSPVAHNGRGLGFVELTSDMHRRNERIFRYFGILLGVLAVSSLAAYGMASWLRRIICAPIHELRDTAHRIAERKDFALRASLFGTDELGECTQAFNEMLDEINARDVALKRSERKLDALVHSIDGIVWEREADSFRWTFVSRQSERLLGFSPEEWLAKPTLWQDQLHPDDAARALHACREAVARGQPYHLEYRLRAAEGRIVWIRESGLVLEQEDAPRIVRGILLDITDQRLASEELDRLHREVVDRSRLAGMAEVASGVLHNVGNVLNSVNVSSTLVLDAIRQSKVSSLSRLAALIQSHPGDPAEFLARDPRGKQIPGYLGTLAPVLVAEQEFTTRELTGLRDKIEHIKEIVAMQQQYARVFGVVEALSITQLVEDSIKLNTGAMARHGVTVIRDFHPVPTVTVDKHKVLQILLNLVRNAKYACDEGGREPKLVTLRVSAPAPDRVQVQVIDNGVGIPPENLTRIFCHGFTTRKEGHGFGLHSAALAAGEMGGTLVGASDGPGLGATFTLELPVKPAAPPNSSRPPSRE